jgi:DNA-binding NarL/FixJ family response regulator
MMRAGLKALLTDEPGIEIVGQAPDGRTAVRLAAEVSPDVVVMDIHMPDLNGIDATRQITANKGAPKVVALSAYSSEHYAREMLRAGASGFVSKESAFDELATAVQRVAAGQTYLSPHVAQVVVADYARGGGGGGGGGARETTSAFTTLSAREREVLQLLAEGRATKEVAAQLHVSVKTVETHRRNLMDKLKLHSVAELTKYAIRQGLTDVDQ